MWYVLGALNLLLALSNWSGRETRDAIFFTMLGVGYVGLAEGQRRRWMVSDGRNLRIASAWRRRVLPWQDVVDVRGESRWWSTRVVLELKNGSVLTLPVSPEVREVQRWAAEARLRGHQP